MFVPGPNQPVHRVDGAGGEPTPLYETGDLASYTDFNPVALADGRGLLFSRAIGADPSWDDVSVMVLPVDGSEPRELVKGATHGRYLQSGHLVFQRQDTLMAVGFDLERLKVTTRETPVLRGLSFLVNAPDNPAQFDISANGTLAYMSGEFQSFEQLIGLLSLTGEWTPLSDRTGEYWGIVPSDDDRYVAVELAAGGTPRVNILEVGRNLLRPVGDEADEGHYGMAWDPEGRWLVFSRESKGGGRELCRYRVGSAATPEVLLRRDQRLWPCDWSSDGRTLLMATEVKEGLDLMLFRFDEQGALLATEPEPFISWPGIQWHASFSRDDKWVLFRSQSVAGSQMYVASVDDPSIAVQISVDRGNFGAWAPDRDRIYYVYDDEEPKTVFAVDYTISEDGQFVPSAPVALFDFKGVPDLDSFKMTADGSAFYIPRPVDAKGAEAPRQVEIVLNWTESIKRLLPQPAVRESTGPARDSSR